MSILQVPFFQDQPVGVSSFTTKGLSTFVVPDDVFFISAVCIGGGGAGAKGANGAEQPGGGGGGLRWINNLPVTPGESLNVFVGYGGTAPAVRGTAGVAGTWSYIARGSTILISGNGAAGASVWASGTVTGGIGGRGGFDASVIGAVGITTGGGNGGTGGSSSGANNGGGGGAGGYSGNGGPGVNDGSAFVAGTNGGAGGGGAGGATGTANGIGGGGVGINGEGTSGTTSGAGGSSGSDTATENGGAYGGGGGGLDANNDTTPAGSGSDGAVRIIYGPNRFFPSTNTTN